MGMFDGIFGDVAPLAAEAAGTSMGLPPGTMSMVGSAIGGIGSYMGQESANKANAAQSEKQMAFQKEQRETSYQTAVEDMKKAGLNPMLAYQQGGAGNQPGAQAQMQSSLGAGVKSTAENLGKYQELRNQNVQERLINSQIDVADADAVLKRATAITVRRMHAMRLFGVNGNGGSSSGGRGGGGSKAPEKACQPVGDGVGQGGSARGAAA
jgi:hypothetical protein